MPLDALQAIEVALKNDDHCAKNYRCRLAGHEIVQNVSKQISM